MGSVGDGSLPVATWMVVPALLTLVGGGILAWTENEALRSRRWIGMTGNGVILVAGILGQLRGMEAGAAALAFPWGTMMAALGWTLSTTMLFVAGGVDLRGGTERERWPWAVPSLIGSLSVMGAPLTAGFVGVSSALAEASRTGGWILVAGSFVGHALLSASTMRWLLSSDPIDVKDQGLFGKIAYGTSLGGLAVTLVFLGVMPARVLVGDGFSGGVTLQSILAAFPLTGWLMWGGGVLVGGVAAWLDQRFRPRVSLWLDALHDVVLLEWGYGLVAGALEQGLGLVRVVDSILGGRAAMLWSSVFLLIVVLMMGR